MRQRISHERFDAIPFFSSQQNDLQLNYGTRSVFMRCGSERHSVHARQRTPESDQQHTGF